RLQAEHRKQLDALNAAKDEREKDLKDLKARLSSSGGPDYDDISREIDALEAEQKADQEERDRLDGEMKKLATEKLTLENELTEAKKTIDEQNTIDTRAMQNVFTVLTGRGVKKADQTKIMGIVGKMIAQLERELKSSETARSKLFDTNRKLRTDKVVLQAQLQATGKTARR